MSRRPGRPTIRSSRPHMQWRTPQYAAIPPSAAGPHRPPSFCRYHDRGNLPFRCPVPTFGSGVLLFAATAYAPGRISTPWSHLESNHSGRPHAPRHIRPMRPPHRGPDSRPRPGGNGNARFRRLVPPRDRPRDRPQRHTPHQPVLHLARPGHGRAAVAP